MSDNAGSLRVLEKTGFHVIGIEVAYASARGTEIEGTILRLSLEQGRHPPTLRRA